MLYTGKRIFLSTLCLLYAFILKAEDKAVRYTENKGQWESIIRYKAKLRGGQVYIKNTGLTYVFFENNAFEELHHPRSKSNPKKHLKCHALAVDFVGANNKPEIQTLNPFEDYTNYFIGSDKMKWAGNVRSYKEVSYKNIYDGIDLHFNSDRQNFKYSFFVAPYKDANIIKLNYSGAKMLSVAKNGNLVIKTSVGEINELKPFAYQFINGIKTEVPCSYKLKGTQLQFEFKDGYQKEHELIIDPTLIYVTYTGSTADNWGMTATYDIAGDAYSGGIVFDVGYPVTAGAFQSTFQNNGASPSGQLTVDMSITKFSANGNTALFSTYLGGDDAEQPQSIVADANNELIIYGRTYSSNYPVTAGCYDNTIGGNYDIVVTKLNATGTGLIGSTFVGGSGMDGVNYSPDEVVLGSLKYNYSDDARGEVVCDGAGNIYVAACTQSTDFPVKGAVQSSFGGVQDGCVFELSADLTTLAFSTYLGGNADDAAYALTLDAQNNIFITGGTRSQNFVTTAGSLHPSYLGGTIDGFLTKLNSSGSAILSSTFIGTNQYDQSFFVQTDVNNNVYIFGQTEGSYPVSAGVYSNSGGKQFIHKLNNTLSATVYSTVFGRGQAQPDIVPSAFLVDECENVYISGWGGTLYGYNNSFSTTIGLPVTSNAYMPNTNGDDFYFLGLTKNAISLYYATFFGGPSSFEHCDGGTSRFDKAGVIYQSVCAGCGGQSDLPTAAGVWSQTNNSSNCNNALIKFQLNFNNTVAQFQTSALYLSGCSPLTVNFQNNSILGITYDWDFGDGYASTMVAPTHVYTVPGSYDVMLVVTNQQSCNIHDTAYGVVTVYPTFNLNPQPDQLICNDQTAQLNLTSPAVSYSWTPSATLSDSTIANPVASPSGTTDYIVVATNSNGCKNADTVRVTVVSSITQVTPSGDTVLCQGETVTLSATSGHSSYSWNTGANTSSINVGASGLYTVITVSTLGCIDTARMNVLVYPHVLPVLSNDTVICEGDTVHLAASGGLNYIWTPSQYFSNDTLPDQTVRPVTTTVYTVTISNEACEATDSVKVSVLSNHTAITASGPVRLCPGEIVTLDAGIHSSYLWNTGSIAQAITVDTSGTYIVTAQTGTCYSSDTLRVDVLPMLKAYGDTIICSGDPAFLYVTGVSTNLVWTPSAGLDNSSAVAPVALPFTNTVYIVSSVDACNTDSVIVQVNPVPLVDAGNDTTVAYGFEAFLNGFSSSSDHWWTESSMLSCSACLNPRASVDTTTQFILYAVNSFGCRSSDTVEVSVEDIPALYVPNCVTPNGDGLNDEFRVYFVGITEIKVDIFNRWGQLIYEWNDLEGFWDTRYKGDSVQEEVYVYTVRATTIKNTQIKKTGTVTVLK